MSETTSPATEAVKIYRPPPVDETLSAKIFAEADRKHTRPSRVFLYWLRVGMQAEPKIKTVLP